MTDRRAERENTVSKAGSVGGLVRVLVPFAALAALFAGGSWVYTHIVGKLFVQAQSATVLPAGLVLTLAVLAGAASFFSPCSLAITPAFLTYFAQHDGRAGHVVSRGRLFAAAGWIALGILAVSAVAALLVGLIGAAVYNALIYLIPLVGLVFAGLGTAMLAGQGGRLAQLAHYLPGRRSYQRLLGQASGNSRLELLAFGAAYGAASHSCTLPIVIGMLMLPLAAGSYGLAATALLIYGIALAGLMLLMLMLGNRQSPPCAAGPAPPFNTRSADFLSRRAGTFSTIPSLISMRPRRRHHRPSRCSRSSKGNRDRPIPIVRPYSIFPQASRLRWRSPTTSAAANSSPSFQGWAQMALRYSPACRSARGAAS